MNKNAKYLLDTYESNSDFMKRIIDFNDDKIYVFFFESLCDTKNIYDYVTKNMFENISDQTHDVEKLIASPKLIKFKKISEGIYYLENGFCLIIYRDFLYAVEAKADIDRGITISQTEQSLFGAKDSFCENFQKNLGVIKRRIKTTKLKQENLEIGNVSKTLVSFLYVENNNIDSLKNKLIELNSTNVDSSTIFNKLNNDKVFPTIIKTEKPSKVAKYILDGYVVILIDNYPFALILDAKLKDFINPIKNDKFLYALRFLSLIITILTPATYLALISFNPETIPTSLLINFVYQRFGVPFPSFIEALIMLLICEILRETDIRFPNAYGSAASILGALILGDAAVNAGIVSPIMIIVISITFITNLLFTQIKFIETIRILRVLFLITAGIFGLYGIAFLTVFVIAYMANIKTMKGSYI